MRGTSTLVLTALLATACGSDERPADLSEHPPAEEAMVPLAASPTDEPAEPEPPPAPPTPVLRVIQRTSMLGWHRFFGVETIEGTWSSTDAFGEGSESVTALGRELSGCSVDDDGTFCPAVGLLTRVSRKRGWWTEERVVLLRRDGVTWADSPCDTMLLVDPAVRAATCDIEMRTRGVAPHPGRAPRNGMCRWNYRPVGRAHAASRHGAMSVRMSADGDAVEAWANAEPGRDVVDHPRYRAWLARGSGWTVAVRIDRRVCGDGQGSALARRLIELTPG